MKEKADLIVDVTGDPKVAQEISAQKLEQTEIISGSTARFIFELIEARSQAKALEDKYQLAVRELEARSGSEFIIGTNAKMKEISHLIDKVAPTPTAVLIRGESGCAMCGK
ncbi:MAG: hypothetical protein NVS9B13_09430 [Candidatus Acidiferrum sp.]